MCHLKLEFTRVFSCDYRFAEDYSGTLVPSDENCCLFGSVARCFVGFSSEDYPSFFPPSLPCLLVIVLQKMTKFKLSFTKLGVHKARFPDVALFAEDPHASNLGYNNVVPLLLK